MNKIILVFILFAILGCSPHSQKVPSPPQEERKASYDSAPEELKIWVDARAGTGEPVHWIADGYVYEYPSGKKLFGLIGFDSSTIIWPDSEEDKITHLTRKTFAYTDLETGEVIKEYNGQKVEPIAYPYQMITYRLENNRIYGTSNRVSEKEYKL